MKRTKFDPSLLPPAPDLTFERSLWSGQVGHVAGVDEAGRGALAGPVAAAAVILPQSPDLEKRLNGLNDSKKLTPRQRDRWADALRELTLSWAVGFAEAEEIDLLGIIPATRLAMARALSGLLVQPHHLLLDFLLLPESSLPQTALTKGDCRSASIAAASVLAKVTRDERMDNYDAQFPQYGFARHKGYATRFHLDVLERTGPCPIHRMSFAPIRHG
jgi:ribonuclease HII